MARDERGVSDSVQWAVLTPLLLLTLLGSIQVGLWAHGRTIASHAAVAGAEEASLLGASTSDARVLAQAIAAGGGLTDVHVTVETSADQARVQVGGRMPTFLDLGQTGVSEQATRPREQVSRP